MTDHHARVDELLAEYRRSKEHLASVHRQLGAISASASNADGSVTATVGPRGTLTGLTITDEAYRRFRPAELAKEIVQTTAAATVRALNEAGELLSPALPAGTDPQALLLGTADLGPEEIAPEQPEIPAPKPALGGRNAARSGAPGTPSRKAADTDDDEDFEEVNWVFDGGRASR